MNKSPTIEETTTVSDAISSMVDQLQAPDEREATPEYDSGSGSGGSMQGSTGSEGLEENGDTELVNGDSHEKEEVTIIKTGQGSKSDTNHKPEPKTKEKSKEDNKTGKSKKKEDKTIGWFRLR